MAQVPYLTTIDNPYDPADQFQAWYAKDRALGYDTLGYLARIINTSTALSQPDQELARAEAIDEIVRENVTGTYRKVMKDE